MMFFNLFYKYAPLLYIGVIFLMQLQFFESTVLYTFLIVSTLLMIPNLMIHPNIYIKKYFSIFLLINLVNLIYLIFFDHTTESLMYAIARFATFSIIIISVYHYKYFYIRSFPKLLGYMLLAILVVGAIVNPPGLGRYEGLFGNPNSLGIIAALYFGLIYLKENFTLKDRIFMTFALLLVLASGSRNALLGIFLAYFLKGSFSIKGIVSLVFGVLLLIAVSSVLTQRSNENTGLERLISSEQEGTMMSGRDMEFIFGYQTVMLSPLIGNGLDKIAYIAKEVVPYEYMVRGFVLNPHNSVIGLWNQYGLIVGTLLFLTIMYQVYKIYRWKEKDESLFFIMAYLLVASIFESILSSINAFEGMIFWSAFAINMISYSMRNKPMHSLRGMRDGVK